MLRVVSWNVRSLRDGAADVAAVLRALAPDLVVLQEAPRLVGWRTSRAGLAARCGLRPLGWARAAGNLLLSGPRVQRLACDAVLLPRRPGLHRRAVARAVVAVGGHQLVVAGTHLDLEAGARLDSAGRVRALLPPAAGVVLGADVNEQPGGPAWEVLRGGLHDAGAGLGPTFPARAPRRRIDALFTSLQVVRAEVVATGGASDHLALLAELSAGEG